MTAPVEFTQHLTEDQLDVIVEEAQKRGLPVPVEVQRLFYQREALRRGMVPSFAGYIELVNPSLLKFEHIPKLIDIGERIVERQLDRVMILLPPRYFKSEMFSKLLGSYYLMKHAMARVALVSYTAHLAWDLSADARQYYQRSGLRLRSDGQAREQWLTEQGGAYLAVGMGGTITGRGFHFGVVDDPVNPLHASSVLFQNKFAHWWSNVWLSRQEPHMNIGQHRAQIAVVMQRLGPSDPIDYLFRQEVGEQADISPQNWHVVCCDEIKSSEPLGRWSGPMGLPPTCTLEPDLRKVGQILAPTRFSEAAVKSSQMDSPLTVAAQRQQRPMAASGRFWQSSWFGGTYTELPVDAHDGGVDWDTAFSQEEDHSASAMVRSYRGVCQDTDRPDEFPIYIDEVDWNWYEFPELVAWMKKTLGPHFVEAKASGKSAVQALKTFGVMAKEVQVTQDKLARASLAQPVAARGRVIVRASVVRKLLWGERQGLLRVTAEGLQTGGAEGLDVNDTFVQAIFRHCGLAEAKLKVRFR